VPKHVGVSYCHEFILRIVIYFILLSALLINIFIHLLYILNNVSSLFTHTEIVVGFLEYHAVSLNPHPNYNPSAALSSFVTLGTIVISLEDTPETFFMRL
jgi:hypothetical protein